MGKDQIIFTVGNWMWIVMVVSALVALIYNTIKLHKEEK